MEDKKVPWNHNYAYNNWISNKVGKRKKILDVGCGNGTLAMTLRTPENHILGIDPSDSSIQKANDQNPYDNVQFQQTTFEAFEANDEKFDAIVFVASIHHMDMQSAVAKAKKLLERNGILIIVGLANPSGFMDWVVELSRVIPSKILSMIRQNIDSEALDIDVSYDFPKMEEVRRICHENLCGHTIRYGLHFRYLLTWENT
ncbi:MAG: class I SAM-dependent methyltransferase [Clostridia bacterium]|nr:class I SAM-dependent methyltransferase [Clostridia bacterium]